MPTPKRTPKPPTILVEAVSTAGRRVTVALDALQPGQTTAEVG